MVPKRDSKKIGFILFTFVALVFVMLTSIRVYAQVSGATMTGTVSDASGAVIPNARVSIKNVATGEARTVTTGAAVTLDQLTSRWRNFVWRNHPDRQPLNARERANARVAIANMLYDGARRELAKPR